MRAQCQINPEYEAVLGGIGKPGTHTAHHFGKKLVMTDAPTA
jgi:hypothetical protein